MEDKNIMEYISKINDRNLAKKQKSGFTVWAILGIISYLLFDLCDKAPQIYYHSEELKAITLIIITTISNVFSFSMVLLVFLVITFSLNRKKRFKPKNNTKYSFFNSIFIFAVQLFILILNIKVSTLYYINNYYINILNIQLPFKFVFLGVAAIFFINLISSLKESYTDSKKINLDENYVFKLDPLQNRSVQKISLIMVSIISCIVFYLHYGMFLEFDFL